MKQSLQLKLGQHLTMTPQLQQAIRLLQLSTLELQQEIQEALDSNPLLELVESTPADDVVPGMASSQHLAYTGYIFLSSSGTCGSSAVPRCWMSCKRGRLWTVA